MDTSTLLHARKLIDALDLASITHRLTTELKWSKKQAMEACRQYKNYLYLLKKYSDEKYILPPSKEIDEVWHAHILHTEDYQRFCQALFGYFLHHQPYQVENNRLSEQNMEDLFENQTQKLYCEEFGEYIYAIRPISIKVYVMRILKELSKLFAIKRTVASKEQSLDSLG